jgi:hypothetical protein
VFKTHPLILIEFHHARNGGREAIPVDSLFFQFVAAEPRQAVELGATIVLAWFPFCVNPTLLLQLVQGAIERSIADRQNVARDLFQALPDRPAT